MEKKTMRWKLKLIPECGGEWFTAFFVGKNGKLLYPIGMFHVDILDYGKIYSELSFSEETEMEVTFRELSEDE